MNSLLSHQEVSLKAFTLLVVRGLRLRMHVLQRFHAREDAARSQGLNDVADDFLVALIF